MVRGWPHRLSALLVTGVVCLAGAGPAQATQHGRATDPVVRWIQRHAKPLDTIEPNAPLADLRPLRRMIDDAVAGYVRRAAPRLLPRLERDFEVIRPTRPDWIAFLLTQVQDKQRYLEHARRAYRLVKAVPHRPGDRRHELALQHARQIVAFYEYYTLDQPNYRDRKLARTCAGGAGTPATRWCSGPPTCTPPMPRG